MTRKVSTLGVDKKLFIASHIMDWAHIRHLPVVDRAGRVVGMVSHRDLLRASISSVASRVANVERNQHSTGISVQEVMHTNVQMISPEAPVQEAARLMREHKIGCLPVVAQARLVGMITEADLLRIVEQLEE
jgi:CBS domain-containing membrane protein